MNRAVRVQESGRVNALGRRWKNPGGARYCRTTPVTVNIEMELQESQPHSAPESALQHTDQKNKTPCSSNTATTVNRWRSTLFMARKVCLHRMAVKRVEEVSKMIIKIDNISGAMGIAADPEQRSPGTWVMSNAIHASPTTLM